MKKPPAVVSPQNSARINQRLAAYLTAVGAGTTLGSDADGAVVGNAAVQPFGVNGVVSIDFNSDGQTDFQIDHDRVNLNGTNLDYLQLDKNDVNSETNPLAFDDFSDFAAATFPPNGTTPNNQTDAAYLTAAPPGELGWYPSALAAGQLIGPDSTFDFQEGDNFNGTTKWIRANRLIDEDATQIDQVLGGRTPDGVMVPLNGPNFIGLNGEVRYLGVRLHLNGAPNTERRFGWIGVRIDNEADATGAVVGYAYETELDVPIAAGDTGPVVANADYDDDGDVDGNDFLVWQRQLGSSVPPFTAADGNGNGTVDAADLTLWRTNFGSATAAAAPDNETGAVPEPGSLVMGGLGGAFMLAWCVLARRVRKPADIA